MVWKGSWLWRGSVWCGRVVCGMEGYGVKGTVCVEG